MLTNIASNTCHNMGNEVLLFVPNIIGYIRLILLGGSIVAFDEPAWFLACYIPSAILDGLDGYFARRLNQTSAFGAWFDVVIDLISRGTLWCFISKWGYFVMTVEWLCFVATHRIGASWKVVESDFPPICAKVMEKGFKTPLGVYAMSGVHVLPLWLYGYHANLFTLGTFLWIPHLITAILIFGRLLAFRVELFYITKHISFLLLEGDTSK